MVISKNLLMPSSLKKRRQDLIEQGYDGSYNSDTYGSVMYQNENLSVRVSDEFMDAAIHDREWWTKAVTTQENLEKKSASDLLHRIAENFSICEILVCGMMDRSRNGIPARV